MKRELLMVLVTCIAGCARSPEQVIEKMKAAACKGDSAKFFNHISRDEVIKNIASFYAEGNQLGEVIAAGLALKMGDKVWDNFAKEINEGSNSQYCNLKIRASQVNESHAKYVVEYSTKELYNWELHKNEAGFQVVKMTPYADFLEFSWAENRESVKKKLKASKPNEADFDHETSGLFELQYTNLELASGFICGDVAFVFLDNRLVSVLYHCPVKSDQELQDTVEKLKHAAQAKYGQQPTISTDGILSWRHVDTVVTLGKMIEEKKTKLVFTAKDVRVDTDSELKKRERKK